MIRRLAAYLLVGPVVVLFVAVGVAWVSTSGGQHGLGFDLGMGAAYLLVGLGCLTGAAYLIASADRTGTLALGALPVLAYVHGHHVVAHHSGGGGVFGWIVKAAVWHVVGRVLYKLPLPVDVALVAVLVAGYVLFRRRRVPRPVDARA